MTIGIIGLGYVGLPLAVSVAETGQQVIGMDTNATRVENLRGVTRDVHAARAAGVAYGKES